MMRLLTGRCDATAPLVRMVVPVWRPRGNSSRRLRSALDQRGAEVELIVI